MKFLFIFCFAGLFCSFTQGQQELFLSKNGHALSTIVIADKASELESKGAKELQSYFQKIGNVFIPINSQAGESISVIVRVNLNLDKHEIAYYVRDKNLYIEGGNPKSTLNAVYSFLENEMNCRFYSPTVEKVPILTDISIPQELEYRYFPDVTTRTVHSRLFYENHDFADKLRVTYEAFPSYVPISRVHTFHRFLPSEKFYDEHPEYYALRNGKRITTQLCLTNESVYKIIRDSVANQLNRYPDAGVISVSQDDNTQYCQCKHCETIHKEEESPAGSMIAFVNRLADEFPEKQISTLAYQYTRKAPKNIKPRPNVLITLCSIECDRSAPIAEKCDDFTMDLKEWSAISDNIRIWDYTTQFTNFLAPFPNLHTIQPNVALFRDNNANWIFEQHSNNPSELFELRSYLTAKLLWNPDQDPELIMDDFLNGYYIKAAPYIKQYIHTITDEIKRDSTFFLFLYGDPSQAFESFLSEELLNKYDQWYDKATDLVEQDPELLQRVNEARLSVDYAQLEFAKRNLPKALKSNQVLERLQRFEETTQKANITTMNEMRYSVDEYIDNYKNTINRAQFQNLAVDKKVILLSEAKKYAKEDPQALTDGALGGASFYSNWLGFEGNDLEAIIDLGQLNEIGRISSAFLQVTNHIVFFPDEVEYQYSRDGDTYLPITSIKNAFPLTKQSKINDIQYFDYNFDAIQARYIKIIGKSRKIAPEWHHGSGLPSWIFIDEVMIGM